MEAKQSYTEAKQKAKAINKVHQDQLLGKTNLTRHIKSNN